MPRAGPDSPFAELVPREFMQTTTVSLLPHDSLEIPGCDSCSRHAAWSQRQIASASQVTRVSGTCKRSAFRLLRILSSGITTPCWSPPPRTSSTPSSPRLRIRRAHWRHHQPTFRRQLRRWSLRARPRSAHHCGHQNRTFRRWIHFATSNPELNDSNTRSPSGPAPARMTFGAVSSFTPLRAHRTCRSPARTATGLPCSRFSRFARRRSCTWVELKRTHAS